MIKTEGALVEHATVMQHEQPRFCAVESQLRTQNSCLLAPCVDSGLPTGIDIWDPELRKTPEVIEILRHHAHHHVAHRDDLLDVCSNLFDGWIHPGLPWFMC